MTVDRNDPRWTTYVLGEMDAPERARFEEEIGTNPDADIILAEIRETAGLLETGLEPSPIRLTGKQHDRVVNAQSSNTRVNYWRMASATGIAALLLLGFFSILTPGLLRSRQSANPDIASLPQPLPSAGAAQTVSDDSESTGEPVAVAESVPVGESAAQSSEPALTTASVEGRRSDGVGPGAGRPADEPLDAIATDGNAVTGVLGGVLRTPGSQPQSVPVQSYAQTFSTRDGIGAAPPPPPPNAQERLRLGQAIGIIAENAVDAVANRLVDRREPERFNTEEYARINDNPFYAVSQDPLATFSADVDTASYANVRRFLTQRTLPPRDAVRIEEMVNYFSYDYAAPLDGRPLRINAEVRSAPWNPRHRLVRIGVQGRRIEREDLAASNLVFLLDVSGSMDSPDKLPLLREGMKLLVDQLGENDRVAIVVYAGASGRVLESTPGNRKQQILRALDRLSAGGSTNGAAGIQLAYETASANFIEGGVNRVILATDGDFNVGITDNGALTRLIEEKAESGVFLSVLGFGGGNLNDAGMEGLADRGNGNYSYIDSIREARKVLVEEMGGTLVTIARDVKFQVEFNPAEVNAYRLIGYENRVLEDQDFNDDTKDAGEIGAGHTVTALFEVVPSGVPMDIPGVDPLRYQTPIETTSRARSGEILTVKVRYKEPDGDTSLLIETPVRDSEDGFESASADYRFASAVAAFGMILRDSPHRGTATLDDVIGIADSSRGPDVNGYRGEFVDLVRRARAIRDLNGLDN
jgi:Ca-activated chloride channel family protein